MPFASLWGNGVGFFAVYGPVGGGRLVFLEKVYNLAGI